HPLQRPQRRHQSSADLQARDTVASRGRGPPSQTRWKVHDAASATAHRRLSRDYRDWLPPRSPTSSRTGPCFENGASRVARTLRGHAARLELGGVPSHDRATADARCHHLGAISVVKRVKTPDRNQSKTFLVLMAFAIVLIVGIAVQYARMRAHQIPG